LESRRMEKTTRSLDAEAASFASCCTRMLSPCHLRGRLRNFELGPAKLNLPMNAVSPALALTPHGYLVLGSGRHLLQRASDGWVLVQRLLNCLVNCERRLLSQSGPSCKHQYENCIDRRSHRDASNRLELLFIENLITSFQ